uniref:Uncharacterized protein n=5 Tax=Aegilops tauschii subsp. strangulata TaxID=200361 RepID=A0A453GF18_AEGTS
ARNVLGAMVPSSQKRKKNFDSGEHSIAEGERDGEEGQGGGEGAPGGAAAGGHAPPRRTIRAPPAVVGRPRAGARRGGGDGGQPRHRLRDLPPARAPRPPRRPRLARRRAGQGRRGEDPPRGGGGERGVAAARRGGRRVRRGLRRLDGADPRRHPCPCVNFNRGADNSVEFAEQVIETNYFGTKRVIEAMLPLLKPSPYGGRIVNVSSRLGRANGRRNKIGDAILREQLLTDDCLSEELIDGMVIKFLEQVKQNSWSSIEWPQMYTDYSVSKLAVNVYTRLMARRLSDRSEGQKIYINCFCPGWVKTAMTDWEGNISAEEGADTGVWLALLPQEQATIGKFYAERREISF